MIERRMRAAAVISVFALVVSAAAVTSAQRVRVSPHEIHEFDADACHITINYGRPSKKGRVIWGGLVPWGRWWMPGADEATIIETSKALMFEGVTMPAGKHTLYMWPDEKAPKLIISKEVGQFHTVYHADQDLGRVDFVLTTIKDKEPVEQMTYLVEARPGGGGILKLVWDDREYSAEFKVKP